MIITMMLNSDNHTNGKKVKEYLAFKQGETKMPEHLDIGKELTGPLFRNKFLEALGRTSIYFHLSFYIWR